METDNAIGAGVGIAALLGIGYSLAKTIKTTAGAVLTSLDVAPSSINLKTGETVGLTATAKNQNGDSINLLATFTFTLSPGTLGAATQAGNTCTFVAGSAPGTGTLVVTASYEGVTLTVSVPVTITITGGAVGKITSFGVIPTSAKVGDQVTFIIGIDGPNSVNLDFGDGQTKTFTPPGAVSVLENHIYTAPGTYTATATAIGDTPNTVDVTITTTGPPPTPVLTTLTVGPTSIIAKIGESTIAHATASDQNGNNINTSTAFTFTASPSSIGTAAGAGSSCSFVAGSTPGAGTLAVTASYGGVTKTVSVPITVTTTGGAAVITSFGATPNVGKVGDTITFIIGVSGATEVTLNFGDGQTKTYNPPAPVSIIENHVFTTAGTFTATAAAKSSNSMTAIVAISAGPGPSPSGFCTMKITLVDQATQLTFPSGYMVHLDAGALSIDEQTGSLGLVQIPNVPNGVQYKITFTDPRFTGGGKTYSSGLVACSPPANELVLRLAVMKETKFVPDPPILTSPVVATKLVGKTGYALTVGYGPPRNPGSSPVTSYKLYYKSAQGTPNYFEQGGLFPSFTFYMPPGQYTIWATAINSVGESAASMSTSTGILT